MKFTKPLIKGKFLKRYKRFFVDVKVNKDIITAHCANTGSMMGGIKNKIIGGNPIISHTISLRTFESD